MLAKLEIIKTSRTASLQDKGRIKSMQLGVPKGGYVDKKSAQSVNKLLGNHKNDLVLEWALLGPELKFPSATYIALSHNSSKTTLNGKVVLAKEKIFVPAGSVLKLAAHQDCVYQYLAIKNSFHAREFLGSKSSLQDYYALENTPLCYTPIQETIKGSLRPSFQTTPPPADRLVRIIPAMKGPEFNLLNKAQIHSLEQYFTLSNMRNRMGIQFNELIPNELHSMLSVPVLPGTIQLTPSGKLILLGKDCQTTGGYPRVLLLGDKVLTTLYQLHGGIKFRFEIQQR